MKIPLSWIKDYVDIDLSLADLCHQMTMAGLEIEAVHIVGLPMPEGDKHEYKLTGFSWNPDEIVVAEITQVNPHPNADKLVLCDLDDGNGMKSVLTGAPNLLHLKGTGPLPQALKVAYARERATIIDAYADTYKTTTLKPKKIRGVLSSSMVCSEKELGISDEHEGIMILGDDAPLGAPLADYLGDAVLDIAITPNIARNANVYGVAREIAAITGKPLRPHDSAVAANGPSIAGKIAIEIPDPEINPRFVVGLIENVEIKPSPYRYQYRLKLAGMRPINNIVDATNYAMLDLGEPLHAFDYDVLVKRAQAEGHDTPTITTRRAEQGEKLITLDNEKRTLDDFTVLVCDQSGPLALAGVMGGLESEVEPTTTTVLLEGAAWNIINTRRTLMAQKLSSEAGYRFSRGVHPELAPQGVTLGLKLMHAWGGGTVYEGLVDNYPQPASDPVVTVTPQDARRWLGIDLTPDALAEILQRLDFATTVVGDEIHATTPPHRLDIGTGVIGRADLMEEIARVYGYENIPETRMADALPPQKTNLSLESEETARDLLARAGVQEIMTERATSAERETRRFAPDADTDNAPYLVFANPPAPDRNVMRRSLLSGMLEVIGANANVREHLALFEIGPVFHPVEGEALPAEPTQLVIALTGPRAPRGWQPADEGTMDFYDLKGVVEALLDGLHIENANYAKGMHPSLHPGKTAALTVGKTTIGAFGELHPVVAERYDLPDTPVLVAELNMDALTRVIPDGHATAGVPAFPPVKEDLAFVVDEHIPATQVEALLRQTGGKTLAEAVLFDLYQSEQLGAGKKSLAYRLTYQADRTLTDKDAAKLRRKIVGRLARELGAVLRS